MTPLAALRSAGQNLADGVVTEPEQVALYGSLVDREGRRLGDMVAQVLELAGMWSGQRSLLRRPVEVGLLIDAALGDLQSELDAHGFEVDVEGDADVPPILGDEGALRRALDNLVANAIKYAGQGAWVGITSRVVARDVEIAVADHGAGISASDLPHIFEPFRRGGEMAASAIPGSGLGLSLVKSIVEDHGGRVAVETSAQGTTFRLRLPMAPMEERESDGH
jgi:signal transduction histidine kinase